MTKKLKFSGQFNPSTLIQELLTALPDLVEELEDGTRQTALILVPDSDSVTIEVPDEIDDGVIQQVLNDHDHTVMDDAQIEVLGVGTAQTEFRRMPAWSTWTPQEAQENVTAMVLAGRTKAQVESEIDAAPNTVAAIKAICKLLAGGIIDLRTVLAILARLMVYVRIVAIRRG